MNIRQLARRLLVPSLFGLAVSIAPNAASASPSADAAPATLSDIANANAAVETPQLLDDASAALTAPILLAQWGPPPRWRRPRWDRPRHRRRHYRRPAPRRDYRPRRAGRSHVNWCLNRYRSYNPRTDQYLGYDGRYHYCRSPFR